MRLHGWCERCRRIKMVNVKIARGRGTVIGVCSDCEEAQRAATNSR
jgi:hypothetical protein